MGYAVILAAIGPICRLIGSLVFGQCAFFVCYRRRRSWAPSSARCCPTSSASPGIFIFGIIIEMLAPSFDGKKDRVQAMKVAIYGATAAWVAGVFFIIPQIAALSIVGLYSLYLLFVGLPEADEAPRGKGRDLHHRRPSSAPSWFR